MRNAVVDLARPATLAIEPYVWEAANHEIAARYGLRPDEVVRYDTNTSPLPPPCLPAVLAQVAAEPSVNEYFDGSYAALAAALAAYTGYTPDHFVIGAGADEIIDVLAKTFLDPGDAILVPTPTYSLYRITAQTMGAAIRALPAQGDLSFDLNALAEAADGVKAIFLCNPNNPTGSAVPAVEIERLIRRVSCLVIVDEAYAEFSGESVLPLVREEPRLIVVRTLSKAFALAGARIGYAVCAPQTAELANRMRPPNSISYISALLGEAALRDLPAMRATVSSVLAQRWILAEALAAMRCEVTPSVANFVLARWPSPEAAARTHEACLSRGMVLRSYAGHPLLGSHLRITARTSEQTSRLIETLRAL
ncbi:MAG TPA: histidinol-phosphate transaminase [Chloroflexota bacterium]|nr:histidinol-phosphate transaminase [Chloroflexota bacterium]